MLKISKQQIEIFYFWSISKTFGHHLEKVSKLFCKLLNFGGHSQSQPKVHHVGCLRTRNDSRITGIMMKNHYWQGWGVLGGKARGGCPPLGEKIQKKLN
jgi:hypothetical protein